MSKKKSEFFPVVFLTLIVLISVVALVLTNAITKDKIAAAKRAAIKEMLGTLFPKMDDYAYDEVTKLYTPLANGEPLGRAFMAYAKGYGGTIDILIGLEPDASIRGIRIIAQQETPGLGSKIMNKSFLDQFQGLAVDDVKLTRNGGKVDAITSATISSSAVIKGVREAILDRLSATNNNGGTN